MISDFSFPLSITKLPHAEDLPLPCYATKGSSGMDIHAALAFDENITLSPGKRVLIPSGLILHIPDGFEAQVRPRSGLALKNGITCLNTPGTIDSDYSEELKILLINLGEEEFTITRGMRIAQIVFSRVVKAVLDEVCSPEQSTRAGGFGSTGMF